MRLASGAVILSTDRVYSHLAERTRGAPVPFRITVVLDSLALHRPVSLGQGILIEPLPATSYLSVEDVSKAVSLLVMRAILRRSSDATTTTLQRLGPLGHGWSTTEQAHLAYCTIPTAYETT